MPPLGQAPRGNGMPSAINLPGGTYVDIINRPHQHRYDVEVSGWDALGDFFAEKTALIWTREGVKELTVGRSLKEGCLVFVRLLQPLAGEENYPVACQAVNVLQTTAAGRTIARLAQFRPQAFFKNQASSGNETPAQTGRPSL